MKKITKKTQRRPTFNNADYYVNSDNWEDTYSSIEEALEENEPDEILGVHSHLLISDSNGIYIPKIFYENFDFSKWCLKKSKFEVLENPEDEWYWEAWNEILGSAKYKDEFGNVWYLHQDGDLFAQMSIENEQFETQIDSKVKKSNPSQSGVDFFVDTINKLRLSSPNKWYQWGGVVSGKKIEIKGFGTWLQIFRVDGMNVPTGMDISVGEFKKKLASPFASSVRSNPKKKTPYFVMSNEAGRYKRRGYLDELPENIIELLDEGYMISLWDIGDNDPEELINELPYGHHPSFAFNNLPELALGDYV